MTQDICTCRETLSPARDIYFHFTLVCLLCVLAHKQKQLLQQFEKVASVHNKNCFGHGFQFSAHGTIQKTESESTEAQEEKHDLERSLIEQE